MAVVALGIQYISINLISIWFAEVTCQLLRVRGTTYLDVLPGETVLVKCNPGFWLSSEQCNYQRLNFTRHRRTLCCHGSCNVRVDIISKSQRCMTQPIAVRNVSNTWLRLSWFATARGGWLPRTLSHWKLNGNDAANYHKGNHFTLAEDIRHKMNKCNNRCKRNAF